MPAEISTPADGRSLEPQRRADAPPLTAAAPRSALGLERMPTEQHFVRNHFLLPEIEASGWALAVDGLVEQPCELRLDDLRRLPGRAAHVVLECAGHRRAEFDPMAEGVQWGVGAMSEAHWAGAALADLLALVRPRPAARLVVLEGGDRGRFRDEPGQVPFARAIPLEKALEPGTLIAWEMNGGPLPPEHGHPVRAVVAGWYATDSVKWLTRISLRDADFDGPFEARDYRLPVAGSPDGRRMTQLPVHALLSPPADPTPGEVTLEGVAWGGEGGVAAVHVAVDRGPWRTAELRPARGPYARTHWALGWAATPGEHEVAVRATDRAGKAQPERAEWNPRGYANNAVARETVTVRDR